MPTKTFQELKASGALPSPPGVGLEILRLTGKADCSIEELAAAIQIDPVLASRLLQVANTSVVRGSQPCTTIQNAAMRLGLRAVRAIGLGFSLVSGHRTGRCQGFDYDAFWSRCLARAVAASEIAARFRVGEPAEMFVAGLLSDIGTLALASVHPVEFAHILAQPDSADPVRRSAQEQQRLGIDHAEAGIAMLEEWKLPEAQVRAAKLVDVATPPRRERSGMDLPFVVWLAARLATALTSPERRAAALAEVIRAVEGVPEVARETLPELWLVIAKNWRRWGAVLEITTTEAPSYEDAQKAPAATPVREHAAAPLATEAPPMVHATDTPAPAAQQAGARVLVVDDDPTTVRLLQSLLTREGHHVTTASGGNEALRLAIETMPQILLCDRSMPDMDGVSLVRTLRQFEAGRRVYVIMLTADDSEEQAVTGLDAGADDYLVKPFRPRLLMARLRAGMRVVALQERVESDHQTMREQVSELGVLTRRLQLAAVTDQLTGMPNRRFAMERMREDWQRAAAARSPLSVMILDVDRFKRVNDTFGHAAGDLVLTSIAKVLQSMVTEPFAACRLGGEEFVVVMPGADLARARAIAETLRAAIAATPVRGQGFECVVTASIGIASANASIRGCEQLLGLADQGLYMAKNGGRNQVRSVQDEVIRRQAPKPVG